MKLVRIFFIIAAVFFSSVATAQNNYCRIINDNWQELQIEFNTGTLETSSVRIDGHDFTTLSLDCLIPSSETGAPCLPLFSRLIEVPVCDGFEIRLSDAEYDTITLSGAPLMPVQPSRAKSDSSKHPLTINNKIYATDDYYSLRPTLVEAVGIARDRNLARFQVSPVRYNPVSGKIIILRHATVTVLYKNADANASMSLFERYFSPHFASDAMTMNSLYPKSVTSAPPIRYLIIAHSSFRGHLDSFVRWKQRKGFITDIVYTNDPGVGTTSTAIASFVQSQYSNATSANPAPTYLLIVGDNEQIPAFTGTTSSHITDLYYVSWTSGDNIPDCYCGRFSAQTLSELTPQIQKTLMYEQYTFADPSFLDRAVLVAGVDGGTQGDFGYTHADPAMDYAAINYINSNKGFTQVKYFKNNTSIVPNAPGVTIGSSASSNSATVRNCYNQGAGFINYSAHGSPSSWGTPNFTTSHVANMTNSQKFGLMIGNCCSTNEFQETNCFGESLLRKGNYCGAVGYIGGSNSTYWSEDFYWAVGLRSNIGPAMSMAYNSSNLGAYDRLCHSHGEAYSQWALSQGSIVMAGNLAVESSSSSRKLYYWEIYHLMGDPSVMPYLTQAQSMTIVAPSVIAAGNNHVTVNAAPYAYIAISDTINHLLVAAAYADASGNATLTIPTSLAVGFYEIAASAQQYTTSFSTVSVVSPSSKFPVVLGITSDNVLEAGASVPMNVYVGNLGDSTAFNVEISLTAGDSTSIVFEPSTLLLDSIAAGDTVVVSCLARVSNTVVDGSSVLVISSASCSDLSQHITCHHTFDVIAPVVNVDISMNSFSVLPGASTTITAVVSNSGHASFVSDRLVLSSSTPLLSVGPASSDTSELFSLLPGESNTFIFSIHADNQLPMAIYLPMTMSHIHPLEIQPRDFDVYIGNNHHETFEGNIYHLNGWTQGTNQWILSDSGAYEGSYCLRSTPSLTHNQTAQISINVTLSQADSISFHYSVSSEANYDKFHFLIDNTDKLTVSGEEDWTRAAFLVPAGTHNLVFTYAKDGSVNRYNDCAWIDNISFPHKVNSVTIQNLHYCQGSEATAQVNTSVPGEYCYVDTIANGIFQIVNAEVSPSYDLEQDIAVCDSLVWLDTVYTATTDFIKSMESIRGCDSIILCHLTVNNSYATTISDTVYTASYLWNDSLYTETGCYTQCFSTIYGCDSVISLLLTFIDTTSVGIDTPHLSSSNPHPSIHPNPSRGIVNIDRIVETAILFDATGREVLRLNKAKTIDLSRLPNGIYILRLTTDGNQSTVLPVIKQ